LPENEDAARDCLIRAGILRIPSRCTVCGSSRIQLVRRNQLHCRHCRHERSLRKGSILEGLRISFCTFLILARFFADNVSAHSASVRLGLAYNTVSGVYHRMRTVIQTTEELRERPAGGTMPVQAPGNGTEQVVFGIRLVDGRIVITRVTRPDPEIISALPIPFMQRGNILFIDAFGKTYHGFITYHSNRNCREIVRIRARHGMPWSLLAEFWEVAGRIWASHKGLDRDQIPVFVQELAFRYNNRGSDLFVLLLERIALAYP
jgi:hypothetical protein